MIKALIVDDDPITGECLKNVLNLFCKSVEVIAIARSVKDAVPHIKKGGIDLVFLDIEMPDENGFSIFTYFEKVDFEVIFVTKNDKFAVQAFKYSAVDYLLKPVDPQELINSVNKVIEWLEQKQKLMQIDLLLQKWNTGSEDKIAVPGLRGIEFIDYDKILFIRSDINYTIFYKVDGGSVVATKTLKKYEDMLPQQLFFRIHKSYVVNLKVVKEYNRITNKVTIENQIQLPVARRRKDRFRSLLMNTLNYPPKDALAK